MTPVVVELLEPAGVPAVLKLVDEAHESDGFVPLSDRAALSLRHGADKVKHVVARTPDRDVAGYLQLRDDDGIATGELVVAPSARRQGVATALSTWALARLETGPKTGPKTGPATGPRARAWAHGNTAAAAGLAAALGFVPGRVVLQMARPAGDALSAVRLPTGVQVRTFEPGRDDEAWVRANARAFAGHPEQGQLTIEDLRERMSEPWFDAAGFFVAERSGADRLAGFHWTKVHERPAPTGEVYAVGVDPDEQGNGLGRALTVIGLAHLIALGVPTLMLYADESNTGAVHMYGRLGFTVSSTDVTYER